MKTFEQFKEAYRPTSLNWNVLPSAKANNPESNPVSARGIGAMVTKSERGVVGPPEGTVTYHKDIGLPKDFDKPRPGMVLRYGLHAKDRADEKKVPLPNTMPSDFEIIEVQMTKYRVEKWVVRFPTDTMYDVVMVVQPDGFVRTTWPNHHEDLHRTLDKSKYYPRVPGF